MTALSAEVGIVEWRPLLIATKSAGEARIGAEARRSSRELAGMAQHHAGPAMQRADNTTNLDIGIAILAELSHSVAILPETHDSEPAGIIRSVWRTDVQEARTVLQLDDVVDVNGHAEVGVEVLCGLLGSEARLLCGQRHHWNHQRKHN